MEYTLFMLLSTVEEKINSLYFECQKYKEVPAYLRGKMNALFDIYDTVCKEGDFCYKPSIVERVHQVIICRKGIK